MAAAKYMIVLANSARTKNKFCVAGKIATRVDDKNFDIQPQWIRLTNPDGDEGAVPYAKTICPGRGQIQPLDIIQVELRDPCNNPDHPEDWYYDPSRPWQVISRANTSCLRSIVDTPLQLWHDGQQASSVQAGFVRTMTPQASSIYLISAPPKMDFCFWKKSVSDSNNPGQMKTKYVRDLSFNYAGTYHEFSVTDPKFMKRHDIWNRMTDMPQLMRIQDAANYFLCLSLGLEFLGRHYKIGATIFEP
jgi:hypothetical protein